MITEMEKTYMFKEFLSVGTGDDSKGAYTGNNENYLFKYFF